MSATLPTANTQAAVAWHDVDIVMLDMDGTVLDLSFDNHFWSELLPQRYAALRALPLGEARAELAPWFEALQGELKWYCLDHWSERTQLDLIAMTRDVRHLVKPLEGSLHFLEAVRAAGKPLWLVTNAHCGSWQPKMEHTGLAGHFDRIVCSHDFGAPKEKAVFWDRFMAQHPFEPSRALFVDDSLPVLRAAAAHGIGQVVAVRRPDSSRPPRVIEEFQAIDGLIDLLPIA